MDGVVICRIAIPMRLCESRRSQHMDNGMDVGLKINKAGPAGRHQPDSPKEKLTSHNTYAGTNLSVTWKAA